MSITSRFPLASRSGLLHRVAVVFSIGLASAAQAQTAPQLLPYTITTVAGGGAVAIANGATCPSSGLTSTDAYGDGCLATEVKLTAPRFVTTDKTGTVFFSDSGNALVRRIDPVTGVITAVAGGASSSPASGTACGANLSTDSDGDGCLATSVKISKPEGLAFSAAGDLYFADNGYDDVRKVAATAGVITTTGVISNVAGGTTYGYNVNNTSPNPPVLAATQSYLNFPYGIAFDTAGNLYIADEGNNALEVVNLTTSSETIQGMVVPAGSIAKFTGYGSLAAKTATSGDCPVFVSTSSRGGCYYGSFTSGAIANKSNIDGNYDVALDSAGNVYEANEFNDDVAQISPGNIITNYAGIEGTKATAISVRATAGTFGIGSNFNVAVDLNANLYTSDAVNGVVWRVDAPTKTMYVIAGGATAVCSSATDTAGDGCPATQSKLSVGTLNGSGYATAPGVAGLFVDPFGSLYITDATTSVVRRASSGTQFGNVGTASPAQIVDIHFGVGNGPATNAYTLPSGSANFSLGTPSCTVNSDNTTDCLLPITATPTVVGPFAGTLQVTSALGATAAFPLSGLYVKSPSTRLSVSVSGSANCTGAAIYATTAPVTLTATIISSGAPTGTITFFANGTQIGLPIAVTSGAATLSYTFATAGTYTITANYSGDSYFTPSTGKSSSTVTTSAPALIPTVLTTQFPTVTAGETALYSFTLANVVFNGTVGFSCSGLPAGASCLFNPSAITGNGCSATNTVALSILSTPNNPARPSSFGGPGRGRWTVLAMLPGLLLALAIGLRRRRSPLAYGRLWMMLALLLISSSLVACDGGNPFQAGTPSGANTVTVTITGTGATPAVSSFTVPFTVQ